MNRQRRAESVKPWRNANPAGNASLPPDNDERPAAGAKLARIAVAGGSTVLRRMGRGRALHFLPLPTLTILLKAL